MSAIITSVLKLTVGVMFNKFRDTTADKLKEGDLTDEKCRQLIVRELDDIKSKLDALIRKDLLSSVEFFRDGMNYLEMAIQDSGSTQQKQLKISVEGASSLGISVAQGQLNIVSDERFKKAKEKFKTAGEEATRAFSNPALSTEDKILATKLRITCSILEGIEDIEAAIKAAVMYLDRLHDLPAIQEAFSVHLDGGLKSMFSKKKRLEIVQAVSIINYELFDFARMVVKMPIDLFVWPKIKLASREYQPVLRDPSIPLTEFGISAEGPYTTSFTSGEIISHCSAINSKGDAIIQVAEATVFIFFAKPNIMSDRHKKFCLLPEEDKIYCMTVDANDNLYIITKSEQSPKMEIFKWTLSIFDSSGVIKQKFQLGFLDSHWVFYERVSIVVNKLGQIVLNKVELKAIYIFDANSQLQRMIPLDRGVVSLRSKVYLTSSDINEIIVAQYNHNTVYIYTAEGEYNRAFHPPKEHTIAGIAFNHITKSIILLTNMSTISSKQMYLLSYGPNAEKPEMLQLDNVGSECNLTSHPNGRVALITVNGVIHL